MFKEPARRKRRLCFAAGVCLLLARVSLAVAGESPPFFGPLELRDEWLLAQTRLTLTATSSELLSRGRTQLLIDIDWGNDFGWRQDVRGEDPPDRRFLIDGEHASLALSLRHGLTQRVELGLRMPWHIRGGGVLDTAIDTFHDHTAALGVLDNQRPHFDRDRLRVEGRQDDHTPVEWGGGRGTGLGNLELATRVALRVRPQSWRSALVGRLALPTGTGTFRSSGVDLGLQLVGARGLSPSVDLQLGGGLTWYSATRRQGIEYSPWRAYGFAAAEWRLAQHWSLHGQTEVSSRLVTNLAEYPGIQWLVRVALQRGSLGPWRLYTGFTEGIHDQQAIVDFGVFLGVARGF